jgi:hypothetical protein
MKNDVPLDNERRRELALHRYIEAFERGNLYGMEAVLSEALDDPELERQITSVNAAIHTEAGLQLIEQDARLIRSLILRHMPSAVDQTEDEPWPTVREVAARIEGNAALRRTLLPHDRLTNRQLLSRNESLPEHATASGIALLAEQINARATDRYWETFRREAVVVLMAHEEAEVELFAARKQGRRRGRPRSTPAEDARS